MLDFKNKKWTDMARRRYACLISRELVDNYVQLATNASWHLLGKLPGLFPKAHTRALARSVESDFSQAFLLHDRVKRVAPSVHTLAAARAVLAHVKLDALWDTLPSLDELYAHALAMDDDDDLGFLGECLESRSLAETDAVPGRN